MIWRPVAIDHWVTTTQAGQQISLSIWPDGWILCRRASKQRCLRFHDRESALQFIRQGK